MQLRKCVITWCVVLLTSHLKGNFVKCKSLKYSNPFGQNTSWGSRLQNNTNSSKNKLKRAVANGMILPQMKKSNTHKNMNRVTNRLCTINPHNNRSNMCSLEPSKSVKKHMRTKYNMGNANYRIQKELHNFLNNPPINCTLDVHPNNIRIWIVKYVGLENSIYANEVYKLKIIFPDDYPLKPPIVYFLQKPPKHTHVYSNGDICLSLLGDDYNPSLSISGLVLSIISMLSSAKEKKLPIDNYTHADAKPGSSQNSFLYHDDKC
ncbi:hypothetical protein AK88_04458 [Plasmodium fragile]|uniref:UBC core domain-containing protein n=1 Tax=Plasmodium fragile TaxID=5857 RepID=A0A0D9QJL6_PLAFR|nr:uncharacterized protein AK88_04458 [Plasmodium fragile]KJP85926.1 hypothetical protein AK88_04458 [Plasmodium fragile]